MNGSCDNPTAPPALSFKVQRNERRNRRQLQRRASWLVLPLLLFVVFNFVAPLTHMLYRHVHTDGIGQLIRQTSAARAQWTDHRQPPIDAMQTFTHELQAWAQNRQAGKLAAAVNRHFVGATSTINRTARSLRTAALPGSTQQAQD